MIIIGLDPGIARTGFGVLDTEQEHLFVRCGCLTTPAHNSLADRLATLGHDLSALIIETSPDQAAVEEIFFGRNAKTAIAIAHARGVLLCILRQHNIPISTFTPLQIKSRLTGYGNASKKQVQLLVIRRLNLKMPPQPDDAADALAAGLCLADTRLPLTKKATIPSVGKPL
ncbi:MAG: crossover junction endodeoxyribonuclease RuvC [bacterium]